MSNVETFPKGWSTSTLRQVCTKITDGTHHSPRETEQTKSGEYLYITAKNIKEYGVDLSNVSYLPERVHRPIYDRCNPENGDVLYIKDGVTTGIATVNQLDTEFSLLSSVCLLKPDRSIIHPRFLKWYLNSPIGFRSMTVQMTGTAIKRLTLSKINEGIVPVAPLPEQNRIVAKIEELFSDLDAGLLALKRVRANLKRYRASVLHAAVTGNLTKAWRRSNYATESAEALLIRILDQRRNKWEEDQRRKFANAEKQAPKDYKSKYIVPRAVEANRTLELPTGWRWASLDQITSNFDGMRVPVRSSDRAMKKGRFPYYGASGIIDHVNDYLFDGEYLLVGEDGANLLSRSTPVAFRASGQFWVNNHAHVLQVEIMPMAYLEIYLNSIPLNFFVTGSAQPKLNQANLNKIPVPIPPLEEQNEIVAEVERRMSVIDAVHSQIEHGLKRAARLRQAILKCAFEGKLVPPDPSDQPADAIGDKPSKGVPISRHFEIDVEKRAGRKSVRSARPTLDKA